MVCRAARCPVPFSPATKPFTAPSCPSSPPPTPAVEIAPGLDFAVSLWSQITVIRPGGRARSDRGRARSYGLRLFRRARAREYDPYKLATPQIYLWRMIVFVILAGFVALIL